MEVNSTSDAANSKVDLQDFYISSNRSVNLSCAWIAGGLGLIQLYVLVRLALKEGDPGSPWKSLHSPFNLCLFIMILSMSFNIPFYYLYTEAPDSMTSSIYNSATLITNAIFVVTIFLYACLRGWGVIEIVNPRLISSIPYAFALFVLVNVANVVLLILGYGFGEPTPLQTELIPYGNASFLAILAFLSVFDVYITCCYVIYLSRAKKNTQLETGRLLIIAQFGVGSNLVLELVFAVTLGDTYATVHLDGPASMNGFLALNALTSLLPFVYLAIQLWMKYALEEDKKNEKLRKESQLEKARMLSGLSVSQPTQDRSDYRSQA
ncbi:hypothetical protein BC830DRAFT_1140471 [Chytriomyces sp. MP71]|nr:hypothetical protein BC830DRAFT_1140471 [Chytriomyces sp. MP71]